MDIRYKYRSLLVEGYNFSNADEVVSAIKSNQVGVKIDPSFKTDQGSIPTKLALKKFFERCEQLGVKDTTYGVQLLLSKTTRDTLGYAIIEDGIYEFLKSYKKPWVKELPEYKEFINSKYNKELWHKLEKAIQDEQSKHGKVSKGSGQLKDVKVAYDDGTWKLMIPSSFEGEKAAAFYIKDGKETPTEWCTRCNIRYYNMYTEMAPLYIIRNMKTGKSYQLAFTEHRVEFLDQNDIKGDEVTTGDLTVIPDKLLVLIKHPKNRRSLLDYKNSRKLIAKAPDKKGYIKTDEAGVYPSQFKYGPVSSIGGNVCKKDILNFTLDGTKDSLSNYFENEKNVEVKIEYAKKHKATAYFLKSKPEALMILQVVKGWDDDKISVDGTTLETKDFQELDPEDKQTVYKYARQDFGLTKRSEREERYSKDKHSYEKYNKTFMGERGDDKKAQENYDKVVNAVNSRISFKGNKKFAKLQSFGPLPTFGRQGEWGTKALYGRTLVKSLGFVPTREFELSLPPNLRNTAVDVLFKKPWHEDGLSSLKRAADNVPWTEATTATVSTGFGINDYVELTPEEFKFCKRVAAEVQKEIIKDPEFRRVNMQRKIEQKAQNEKEARGNHLSKQEIENAVGKKIAYELTHLDEVNTKKRFPVHAMKALRDANTRPALYEEINYFDY